MLLTGLYNVVIVVRIQTGRLLQSLTLKGKSVHLISICPASGNIVSHSAFPSYLTVHSITGNLLAEISTDSPLGAMTVIPSAPGFVFSPSIIHLYGKPGEAEGEEEWVVAGEGKKIYIRRLPSLKAAMRFECLATVTSLQFVAPNYLMAGLEDGQLSVFLLTP